MSPMNSTRACGGAGACAVPRWRRETHACSVVVLDQGSVGPGLHKSGMFGIYVAAWGCGVPMHRMRVSDDQVPA